MNISAENFKKIAEDMIKKCSTVNIPDYYTEKNRGIEWSW